MATIRRAIEGDEALWLSAVAAIISADERDGRIASRTDLAAALADSRCYLFRALSGESPVGLLSAYAFPDVEAGGKIAYLYDIEVDASHRRAGTGAALTTALLECCEAEGIRLVWAGTDAKNLSARRTFESTDAELEGDRYVEYEWDLE